jgi:hypothetical protein
MHIYRIALRKFGVVVEQPGSRGHRISVEHSGRHRSGHGPDVRLSFVDAGRMYYM